MMNILIVYYGHIYKIINIKEIIIKDIFFLNYNEFF